MANELEDRILEFIQENPGCHLRQIKKNLNIAMGTVQYWLNQLERKESITSVKNSLYKFYYPFGTFQENEKKMLQMLSQETARDILIFILERRKPTQTDIVKKIGISAAAVNWHVKRLVDYNIISEIKEGKYRRYCLCDDPRHTVALLKNYYPSIWNNWSNRIIETFLSLSRQDDEEELEDEEKDDKEDEEEKQ